MAGASFNIGINTGDSSASIEKLIAEIKKIGITARQIVAVLTGQTKEVVDSFDKAIDEIDKASKELSELENSAEGTDEEIDKLRKKIDELSKKLEEAGGKTKKANGAFGSLMDMFGKVSLAVNQSLMVMQKLGSFVSKPLEQAGKFQTMQMSLEVLLGSADKAKQRLKELSDFTKGTSFELPEVVEASKELQSLGKYSQDTLKTLSTLAMGTGKSLGDITKAYSGLARGRKNMAVELFRDIGITTEDFVKATGKGIDSATGMIKASSQEMINALGQIVRDKNFEGLIEKQAQTFEGQLGNFKDSWNQFLTELGMVISIVSKNLLKKRKKS